MKRSWTIREEANAITCCAFRNGFLEDLHARQAFKTCGRPETVAHYRRGDEKLMIESSNAMATLLAMKQEWAEPVFNSIALERAQPLCCWLKICN